MVPGVKNIIIGFRKIPFSSVRKMGVTLKKDVLVANFVLMLSKKKRSPGGEIAVSHKKVYVN
ncbi:hypothetical protein ES705_05320 [subsurface metagenome]